MEVSIITKGGSLEANFEEAKEYLQEQLAMYSTCVFTEATKKDAKNTVASLRKDKQALIERVRAVKAEYMKPYDEFYAKACELIEMYDKPIGAINEQIQAFEEKRVEEKRELIKSIYAEMIPEEEWQEVLPLSKIYNRKWENATTTRKAICEEIMQAKTNAKSAYETIKAMNSDKEAEALRLYNSTFDLQGCLLMIREYEASKAEILEREREAEIERVKAEERAKIEAEQRHAEELKQAVEHAQEQAKEEAINDLIPADDNGVESEYNFLIRMTEAQKEKLEMFMDSIGIEYMEV